MPETSTRVTDRLHRSQTVEHAAAHLAAAAAAGCAAAFVTVTELTVPPTDVEQLFHLTGRHLGRHRRQLVAADTALADARKERFILRQCQDAAAAAARSELIDLRRLLKSCFGARETARFLALNGATPREAGALRAAICTVRDRLADPGWQPPLHTAGVRFDYTALAARLAPVAVALDVAMSDLEAQRWRERDALETQRRALAAFDRVYGNVARFLEAFLELVGHEPLARRVRPGVGRRGRPPADAVQAATPSSSTLPASLRTRLQKACTLLTARLRLWRKDDNLRATSRGVMQKEKILPASRQEAMGKASRQQREIFRPWKTGDPDGERRAA